MVLSEICWLNGFRLFLKEDVYALPSVIGGIVYYLMVISNWVGEAVYGAFTVVLVIRLLAIKYNWSLPKVR